MTARPLRLAALAAAAGLSLAACTTPAAPEETPDPVVATTPEPAMSAEPTPTETRAALDPADAPERLQFSATTLDGAAFEGTSLYGQPTIVWFWAPWCPICQAEAPMIVDALDELPDGVQAIGIPGRSDRESMQAFVDDYGFGDLVQVVDEDGSLWSNFFVASQPAVALIDAEGNIQTLPGSIGKAGFLQAAESIA